MIRIGLVGAGSMGSLHARVISTSPTTQLAWIADPVAAVGESLAARTGTTWLPEPRFSDVDAVVVAAPTEQHSQIAAWTLDAGRPLLMEKPLADDLFQVEAILERSAALGVPVMCGLLERFNPAVRTAMDILDEPWHLRSVRHSPYVDRIRTGVANDLLIHDVDLAVRLFADEPASIRSHVAHLHPRSAVSSEDAAEVSMMFAGGQMASLSASRLSQRKVREMVVAEQDRLIEVDLLRQAITIYRHIGETSAADSDGLGYRQQAIIDIPVIRHLGEPLALQLQHFVGLIEGAVDMGDERRSIELPHRLVAAALDDARHRFDDAHSRLNLH